MRRVLAACVLVAVLAACSSDDGDDTTAEQTTTTRATTTSTTTTRPTSWTLRKTRETPVAGRYRQGLARDGDSWLFTTNNAIYRNESGFTETQMLLPAIPQALAGLGYNHIGDGDVSDGLLWVPFERDDKESGEQVTAWFDAKTFDFMGSFPVPQHHNSFVTIDDDGVLWSTDEFSDDTLQRYEVEQGTLKPLEPLKMSRLVDNIQGADFADGALWLSTDDAKNGLYRVDVETGKVTDLGTMGHAPEGEGEGIDATDLPSGLLHVLVADEEVVPMYVVDFEVVPKGG